MSDRRAANIEQLRTGQFDVLVIGGGINGAGIARDLVLRDPALRVALVEKNHFASGTSGKNSQLIHGGLRYLRYLEFHLVHEALRERATLLRIAPGLVEPLQFLIPCYRATDRWFYGAGLALYDLLAGERAIGRHTALSALETREREPDLSPHHLKAGLLFYDCRVNSARLVLENILDAEARGAVVANYVEARLNGKLIEARDTLSGEAFCIRVRKIVDATGAWSDAVRLRLVRGSHLIFPRLLTGEQAIAYFDEQGRIVFLIPWGEGGNRTLVGTTDVDHDGNADNVHISEAEAAYLTSVVNRLFPDFDAAPISSYSSLRPLIAESGRSATSTSREHRIWETSNGVLHIAGGKFTTYRAMSEELVDMILPKLPCRTAETPLNLPALPADPMERVRMAIDREYARKLEDIIHVSTYWGYERPLDDSWLDPIKQALTAAAREHA
jgi:glycerol-3-phosphate dehydrogenase